MSIKGNKHNGVIINHYYNPAFRGGNSIFYCAKNTTVRYKNLMTYENEINEHLLIDFM